MKVIRYDNKTVKLCNVQVRDLIYISRKYNLKPVMDLYLSYINKGFGDTDFISVTETGLLKLILNDEGILDLSSYVNCDISTLSRMIVLGATGGNNQTMEHRKEDLDDLIDYNRGMLNYTIPLFVDGLTVKESKDKKFVFYSTCFPEIFLIKKRDRSADFSINLGSFYEECIHSIYEKPMYQCLERDVHFVINDDYMVLKINPKSKKKVSTRIKEHVKKLQKKKEG